MMNLTLLAVACLFPQEPPQPPPEAPKPKPTVVVTATRSDQEGFELPRAVTTAEPEHLHRRAPFSLLDSLKDQPGIWVEKRTLSTSDIVIRGLSGSNVIALIDGNTLSTLWGEGGFAGDDMYGKVDADSIERIEVVRGPGSVLYGSNALGGVVNFFTKSCPIDFTVEGWKVGAFSKILLGTPSDLVRLRQEIYAAGPELRFIFGGSYSGHDDVEAGGRRGRQNPTSGRELNWDAKIEWMAGEREWITATIQDIDRDKVHRFYRPAEDNWNDRLGVSVRWDHRGETGPLEQIEAKVYYQEKIDRRFWKATSQSGKTVTETYSADLRVRGPWHPAHTITGALQYHVDFGESPDDEQFTNSRPAWPTPRKDAPDSEWHNAGIVLQDEWEITSWLSATLSLRGDIFVFQSFPDSQYMPPGGWNPALDKLDETQSALTGGAGFLIRASEAVHPYVHYARGYRLWPPKFGVTQQGYGVLVPTMGFLDPMYGDTYEIGCKVQTEHVQAEAAFYYTDFSDFQVIVPGLFMGSDWYDFDGDTVRDPNENVYVIRNAGDAFVFGAEIGVRVRLDSIAEALHGWWVRLVFAANQGEVRRIDEPLRHTQPMRGAIGVGWEDPDPKRGLYVEFVVDIVDRFDDIPSDRMANDPGYRRNPQSMASPLLRSYGLPGYVVADLRAGVNLFEGARLALVIENVSDVKYRRAHSRWDEQGLNATLSISVRY